MATDKPQLMPFMQRLLHLPEGALRQALRSESPQSGQDTAQEQAYLIGSRCGHCGHVAFPPKEVCPACLKDDDMAQIPLSRRGKIDTCTVSRVAPPGFEAPYIQAFIRLPEGPRIFSLITGCPQEEGAVEIGQEVELVVERLCRDEKGNDIIGYKFKPVREG